MFKHVLCLIGEGVILTLFFILLVYVVLQGVIVYCIGYTLVEFSYWIEEEKIYE